MPRGARWDAPVRFDAASDWAGGDPPGLNVNAGATNRLAVEDREAQIAALLTVRPPADLPGGELGGGSSPVAAALGTAGFGGSRHRDYDERRVEAGDTVTILGSALPFGDVEVEAGRR